MSKTWFRPDGRSVLPVLGVWLLGVLGGALGYHVLRRTQGAEQAVEKRVRVTVASRDIAAGSALTAQMTSERLVPEHSVSDLVVRPAGAAFVVGQKVTVPVLAGEMLSWSQFEAPRNRGCAWIEQAAGECAGSRRSAEPTSEQLTVSPEPGSQLRGRLVTASRPIAKLLVDGHDTGRWTPIPPAQPLELPAGQHLVTFVAGDGRRTTRTITVTAGETAKVTGVEDFQ
jgi:hypothetical protein